MGIVDQVLRLPYAYFWLPTLAFIAVVGFVYRFTRAHRYAQAEAGEPGMPVVPITLSLKPKDLRGASRRQGNTVEVHVARPEDKDNPELGSVLDRSMGGMRLALYNEIEAGAVLAIRPVNADAMVPWVEVEVRSCKVSQEIPGQFEVGCQYVKSPPYSIQLLFG